MLIQTAQASGVIEDAPTFAKILLNMFAFLLQVAGVIGIIGIVIAGLLYFFANGDRRRIALAKTMTGASIIGFVIFLGAWVIIKTITGFFTQG
jgi:ABC-type cobalamin transport system permease subunit